MTGALLRTDFLNDWKGRIEIWERGLWLIQDFPLTGTGMGLYGPQTDLLHPFVRVIPGSVPHAHNLFIQVAADLGIPGLVAWLAVAVMAVWMAARLLLQGEDFKGIGAGLLVSLLAMAIHGLFDAVVWGMVRTSPLVWLMWGLTTAAWKLQQSKRGQNALNISGPCAVVENIWYA